MLLNARSSITSRLSPGCLGFNMFVALPPRLEKLWVRRVKLEKFPGFDTSELTTY